MATCTPTVRTARTQAGMQTPPRLYACGQQAPAPGSLQDVSHLLLQLGSSVRGTRQLAPQPVSLLHAPLCDALMVQRRQLVLKVEPVRQLGSAPHPDAALAALLTWPPTRRSSPRTQCAQTPRICSSHLQPRQHRASCQPTELSAPRNASSALSAASLVCASMMACTLSACACMAGVSAATAEVREPEVYLKQVQTPCRAAVLANSIVDACTAMRAPFMNARMVNSPGEARRAPARCAQLAVSTQARWRTARVARTRHSESTRCTQTLPPWQCSSTTSSRVYDRGLSIGSSSTCTGVSSTRVAAQLPPDTPRPPGGCRRRTRSRSALGGTPPPSSVRSAWSPEPQAFRAETAAARCEPRRRLKCARWRRRCLAARRA